MSDPIKDIKPEHRECARLKAQGLTHRQIAEKTGYSHGHIKNILRNPHLSEVVRKETIINSATGAVKDVQEVLDRAKLKAVLLLEQIVDDSDTLGEMSPGIKQRMDAAIEILGMVGISSKNTKVDHEHKHILKYSDVERIRERARDLNIIDVKAVAVSPN